MADLSSFVVQQLETENEMLTIFQEAGFENIEVIAEDYEDVYQDENAWWESLLSTKDFALIHPLDNETKEKIKSEAFIKLQDFKGPDGFHFRYRALFTLATNPT